MVIFSLEIQRRLVQTEVNNKLCYSIGKETSHKPLKVATAKKSFPSVYIIDATCFDESILFPVRTGRHILYKFIVIRKFSETAMLLCYLKQVCWKKSWFYIRYLHNTANTKGSQQSFYFLNLLTTFFFSSSLWMFHIFHYKWYFKTQKLKSSLEACFLLLRTIV